MQEDKIKVLYITGWGRSGSTIIGNILGQLEGFFHVGEIHLMWRDNLVENRLCGCGLPFRECEVWRDILSKAFGEVDRVDPVEMIHLHARSARTRHLLLMLMSRHRALKNKFSTSYLSSYQDSLDKLYQAIKSTTGCRVIVDSSKLPSYGHTLETIAAVDFYVVHLVRDPRAVAYSWRRKRLQPDKGNDVYLKQYHPLKSSLLWGTWNMAAQMLWRRYPERYLLLRYEDFVDRPLEAFMRILSLVQEEHLKPPFVSERVVRIGGNHTVSGNPNRLQTGTVELRADEEWRTQMDQRDKTLVTILTWPMLRRYGYRS